MERKREDFPAPKEKEDRNPLPARDPKDDILKRIKRVPDKKLKKIEKEGQ